MLAYDLDSPNWTRRLPKSLRELSGLAINPGQPVAWAVNDEQGRLYCIDLNSGDVSRGPKFAKKGDYEGIAMWRGGIIVAHSNSRLYYVNNNDTQSFKGPLTAKSNVEGLALDTEHDRLLVACKGPSKGLKGERHIYAVGLPSFEWSKEPAYVINRGHLQSFLRTLSNIDIDAAQADEFAPSAIAVHPTSAHVYLLSSRAKLLVVLDARSGEPCAAAHLDRQTFPQPEALDFDAAGAMYVGSEGRDGQALIHRFDPRSPPRLPF